MISVLRSTLGLIVVAVIATQAMAADYQLEQVKGNVYRFLDDRHRAMVVVSDDGILLMDTINYPAARWLKEELRRRFQQPVKYVVYSHNHHDHITGADVFDSPETAFIAHKLAAQDIVQTGTDVVKPDITFDEDMVISLGGQDIELRYHGPNDGRGSISALVKPEKVLFAVDWLVIGRMPWRTLQSYDIRGVINSLHEVQALDYEIAFGGHADVGDKAAVQHYLNYLEDLQAAVISGINKGYTLEDLQTFTELDEYSDLKHYEEWLSGNIAGAYERMMEESGMGWR